MALKTTIQLRRDILSQWQLHNPILAAGEIALVDKSNGTGAKDWVIRVGDGTSHFNDLPEMAYALSADVLDQLTTLNGKIDNKVKVDGSAIDTLSIERIDAVAYHEKVVNGTVDANTIYIVNSDNLNAFGEKVTNVKDGSDPTDAVNVGQLTAAIENIVVNTDNIADGSITPAKMSSDPNDVFVFDCGGATA